MTERVDQILADDVAREALRLKCTVELGRRRGWSRTGNVLTATTVLIWGLLFVGYSVLTGAVVSGSQRVPWGMSNGPGAQLPTSLPTSLPIVRTRSTEPATLVDTREAPDALQVSTRNGTTLVVRTSPRALPLGDAQLLASFPGRQVGIVTELDGTKELVFLDEESRE